MCPFTMQFEGCLGLYTPSVLPSPIFLRTQQPHTVAMRPADGCAYPASQIPLHMRRAFLETSASAMRSHGEPDGRFPGKLRPLI